MTEKQARSLIDSLSYEEKTKLLNMLRSMAKKEDTK